MMRSHIVICLSLCLFLSTVLAATPEPIRCKEDKCATVRCATGPCVMDSACNPVCTTPAPVTTSTSTSTSTPTPTPTPTPTTTPEPLQCRIMGGAVPPQCPKTYVWDSTICKFVCCPNACPAECEFGCNEKCECKQPRLGETVRTISFRLRYESSVSYGTTDVATVVALANAMRDVGDVGGIPRSDYIINNDDFKRIEGRLNSKSGKWSIKIGFRAIQHPDGDRRKEFVKQLKLTYQENLTRVKINAADNDGLLFLDETEEVIEAKEFYEFQTCQDGRTITADKQCEAVTFAATVAATSSSTSIPIVAIIAPIIGGIVLIAIIATALIIRRRRADNVKTIENIARDTADMETNPAIAAVQAEQVEGADRV